MSRINVRNMQRIPHHHTYRNYVVINGRDVCDTCPYRIPRWKIHKPLGTKREAYDFEVKFLLKETIPTMTVPKLRETLVKRNPNAKGVSKMRRAELVSAILDLVK